MKLEGWGRYPSKDCRVEAPNNELEISKFLSQGAVIARGNGRSYGDSSLNVSLTLSMERFNCLLEFDSRSGLLVLESGVRLETVLKTFLPLGWFPPVSPGTKFVTIGGMVAADVHGKNHHRAGTFGNFICWLDIVVADGTIKRCSASENPELFKSTIGGMGLTGVIVRVAFYLQRVESGWIKQETVVARDLKETMDAFETSFDWTYTVAWIDSLSRGSKLGRSLLFRGEHAKISELGKSEKLHPSCFKHTKRLKIGFDLPALILNRHFVKVFNWLYYKKNSFGKMSGLVEWEKFFYPLDRITDWNRLYGKNGFIQFQCVLPLEHSYEGIRELLEVISDQGVASFLAVLKLFGPQGFPYSFPMRGYTLALDFPANKKTFEVLEKLDEITVRNGGRFYLAKDSRIDNNTFAVSDPRFLKFNCYRKKVGAFEKFQSEQSKRLQL